MVNLATLLAFVVSLCIQVALPLGAMLAFRRHARVRWLPFVYGAFIYALFQLFTWLPLSVYLDVVADRHIGTETWAFAWLWVSALMTSVVEELGRYLGYRWLFRRGGLAYSWRNGVAYGLGHGALETMLLIAGMTFVYMLAYVALCQVGSEALLAEQDAALALVEELDAIRATQWTQPLVVAFERVLALPHQVAWALLVMQSVAYRQKRWFTFAVLYHMTVALVVPGLARLAGFAVAEGVNLVFAVLSVWIILKTRVASPE